MKWVVIVLFCAVAYAEDLSGADLLNVLYRSWREAYLEGTILGTVDPFYGLDISPFYSNYDKRAYDRNAYSGPDILPGQAAGPPLAVEFTNDYDYTNGRTNIQTYDEYVQSQRGRRGGISPNAGIRGGSGFGRDVHGLVNPGEEEKPRFRRESDTGLVAQDLNGPPNNPFGAVGWNQRVIERDGSTDKDIFGGTGFTSEMNPSPELRPTLRKDFDNGPVGRFARADKNPLGSFSPSYGVGGSYKAEDGWRTDLSATQTHDPWGMLRSIGTGFWKEFNSRNGYDGVNGGTWESPSGDRQRQHSIGVGLK